MQIDFDEEEKQNQENKFRKILQLSKGKMVVKSNKVEAGDGDRWLASRDILKTELTGFADNWIQWVRERDFKENFNAYQKTFIA